MAIDRPLILGRRRPRPTSTAPSIGVRGHYWLSIDTRRGRRGRRDLTCRGVSATVTAPARESLVDGHHLLDLAQRLEAVSRSRAGGSRTGQASRLSRVPVIAEADG